MAKNISIYPGKELREAIGVVGPREISRRINRIADRYHEIIRRTQADLLKRFSEEELNLLKDSMNGAQYDPATMINIMPHGVADSMRLDELDKKWQVDGPALLAKLKELTFAEKVALVEYVEAFWARTTWGDLTD